MRDLLLKIVRARLDGAEKARERFLKLEGEAQRAKAEYESMKLAAERAGNTVNSFIENPKDFDQDELFNI